MTSQNKIILTHTGMGVEGADPGFLERGFVCVKSFDSLNENIEMALDITNNVIIVGDMNEDLLNPNCHNLKDILILNSLNKIISQPTRQHALLDPIIFHNDMSFLHQCILEIMTPEISDHNATYLYLLFQYPLHRPFPRKV